MNKTYNHAPAARSYFVGQIDGADVIVAWRGEDRWAITHAGWTLGLSNDGAYIWDYEPSPSNRDEDYLSRSRFSLAEAFHHAQEVIARELQE